MTNRLAGTTSPYLLQHAENPVHWQPWDEQALTSARVEDKPILLSIGYSACHWCHVMAHESFEDPAVAEVMNRLFVNIKVDREERPDLDHIYQSAHQMLAGRPGGWPLTLFMTPDGTPFFAGTYFPKQPRFGLPSFPDLCEQIADLYRTRATEIAEQNRSLRQALTATLPQRSNGLAHDHNPVDANLQLLLSSFDPRYGGFGAAPKFPHTTDLAFLLRHSDDGETANSALISLTRMAEGGLYDQIGGGFFRYSVDERWEIPHFEKMLYDNALLLGVYADAWALTERPLYGQIIEETIAWAERELQLPGGGFASSLDADSLGEEGRYYRWYRDEIRALLTADEWSVACRHWGLDGPANFENRYWHLRVAAQLAPDDSPSLTASRAKLLAHRAQRAFPRRDDKVLAAWNALMITGMVRAARVLDRADWLASARRAMTFVRTALWRNGRLLASWRDGKAYLSAYLDDYAFLLEALIEFMQADFRSDDMTFALALANALLEHFEDRESGGFHFTADDHEALIHRPKPLHDNATPAGNAVAIQALQDLGRLVGEQRYFDSAERALALFQPQIARPGGISSLVMALEDALTPPATVILRGPRDTVVDWSRRLARAPGKRRLTLALANGIAPLPDALDRPSADSAKAWICTGTACQAPIADFEALRRALSAG